MTLTQIKSMFIPGEQWRVERQADWGRNCDEIRTVKRLQNRCLVWTRADGKEIDTDWPKAGDILNAAPGLLEFRYPGCIVNQQMSLGPLVKITKATPQPDNEDLQELMREHPAFKP